MIARLRRPGVGVAVCWLIGLVLFVGLGTTPAMAQEPNTYTVQPGDTLGAIATRFGIPLETLAAANGITDVNVLNVGQVLSLPGHTTELPIVVARSGETLQTLANRIGLPADQLSALNELKATDRLFPGQPVRIPAGSSVKKELQFGAVEEVRVPESVVQGQASWMQIRIRHPLTVAVAWNGVPLRLQPIQRAISTVAEIDLMNRDLSLGGYVPTPALMGPGPFTLQVSYLARNGVPVTRTFPVFVHEGTFQFQQINVVEEKGGLLDQELLQSELARLWEIWSQTDTPIQWRQPLRLPLSAEFPTTSPYGTRRSYNGGPYRSFHSGQDFGAPGGMTVTAPADGIVVLAEPLQVRGNSVVLDHGGGVFTGYWHLRDLLVEPGRRIEAGEPLGLVGTTGLSTGDHLHWELRIYGLAVDPMQFLDKPLFPIPDEMVLDEQ